MYYSLLEIFSIGVGPSSSHTVGPMRAAKRYIDNLRAKGLFDKIPKWLLECYIEEADDNNRDRKQYKNF